MYSARRTAALPAVGFPIRKSPDQSLVSGSPKLIAATRVLHRLLSPRHPSCALSSLVIVSSRPALALRLEGEDQGPARSRTPGLTRDASVTLRAYSSCAYAIVNERCFRNRWWSRSGSNRRHPACKAGALPAELRPRETEARLSVVWAWIDLNYRPHAYQACALTN